MSKSYSLERLRTMRSHQAHANIIAEMSKEPIGYLARCQVEDIPSPYAYSPTVLIWDWNGRPVVIFETAHRRFEVFAVHPELLRFATDDEATEWHIRYYRKAHA